MKDSVLVGADVVHVDLSWSIAVALVSLTFGPLEACTAIRTSVSANALSCNHGWGCSGVGKQRLDGTCYSGRLVHWLVLHTDVLPFSCRSCQCKDASPMEGS